MNPLEVSLETQKVFELFPALLSFLDEEGRFLKVNPAWELKTEYPPQTLVGSCLLDFLPIEEQPAARREIQALRAGADRVFFRAGFRRKEGGYHYLDWQMIRPIAGGPVFAVAHDLTALHEAERALEESREKFRILADTATEGIVLSDQGVILGTNAAMSRMSGFSPEEIVGREILRFVPAKDHAKVVENLRREGTGFYELTGVRKDGSCFPMEIMGSFMNYRGRPVRVTILRDVTEREQLLELAQRKSDIALQDKEKFFRALSENALDVVLVHNERGSVRYLSPSTQWVLGYDPVTNTGKNVFEFVHPDDLGTALEALKNVLAGGKESLFSKMRIRHHNGSWRDMELISRNLVADPIVRGVVVNLRDVTDQRHAENALRESEARLRSVFNTGNQTYILVDLQGRIQMFNWVAQEYILQKHGKSLEPGQDLMDVMEEKSKEIFRRNFIDACGGAVKSFEVCFSEKDGRPFWMETTMNPVRDDTGIITGVCVNSVSIDERKKAQNRLMQVQRLAAIGQVTGAIAHEIRNPLSVIAALARQKSESGDEDGKRVVAQTEKITRLMDDILEYARRPALKRVPLSPATILQAALESARAQAGEAARGVTARWKIQPFTETLSGDKDRMEQVFHNLILNAFQAMSGGGCVTLSCFQTERGAEFMVEDEGPGIQPKDLECVFEPFTTTKKLGTGLGLAISRKIVEDHGGTLEASRREPNGMVFKVRLPFSSPMAE